MEKNVNGKPLSLAQIALLHYYLKQPITMNNADAVASRYGHKSGSKLAQHHAKFLIGSNERRSGKLAVLNIERVIKEINNNPAALKLAEDELKIARTQNT